MESWPGSRVERLNFWNEIDIWKIPRVFFLNEEQQRFIVLSLYLHRLKDQNHFKTQPTTTLKKWY
jgi:hypothetical protein